MDVHVQRFHGIAVAIDYNQSRQTDALQIDPDVRIHLIDLCEAHTYTFT